MNTEEPRLSPPRYPPRFQNLPRSAPDPVANEDDMLVLADRLEDASVEYSQLCEELATADADYHRAFYTAMVELPATVKPAEKRKAMASLRAMDEYAAYRMLQERQRAALQFLRSLTTKIDVRRTVAANYRNQG